MSPIAYRRGYKYQLGVSTSVLTPITGATGGNDYVWLHDTGWLGISAGYAWDGASGPAIDTRTIRRASLVHDALYQLIREGVLPRSRRDEVDEVMRAICLEDGMWRVRAWWVHHAVRKFGDVGEGKPILYAP